MIGPQITTILQEFHLSQKELAEKIGVKQSYISQMKRNEVMPSEKVCTIIAQSFQLNLKWLQTGEGEMYIKDRLPLAKKELIEMVHELTGDQAKAVLAFVKLLRAEYDRG